MRIEAGKYYKTRDGRKVGPMNVPPKNTKWSSIVKSDAIVDGAHKGWCDGGRYSASNLENDLDLIAEWTDEQIGTLAELDVKPGDVVTWHAGADESYHRYNKFSGINMTVRYGLGVNFANSNGIVDGFSYACLHKFRLISRATTKPSIDLTAITTPFGLLDKATQDALVAHGGPVEQYTSCGWHPHVMHKVSYHPSVVYRVKPGPKRETVTKDANIWTDGEVTLSVSAEPNCTITYDTIDGVIDMATYRVVAK